MSSVLTEIINLLVGGLTTFATGFGSGVQQMVSSLFLDTSGTNPALSTFGGLIVVFGAIALTLGISRWIMNFVTSLGARNR